MRRAVVTALGCASAIAGGAAANGVHGPSVDVDGGSTASGGDASNAAGDGGASSGGGVVNAAVRGKFVGIYRAC